MVSIYADRSTRDHKKHPDGTETWVEDERWPGHTRSRVVVATVWVETARDNCFCCSCSCSFDNVDPYCRNHGWYVTRPCEKHNMPGQPGEDGDMPESVQKKVQGR